MARRLFAGACQEGGLGGLYQMLRRCLGKAVTPRVSSTPILCAPALLGALGQCRLIGLYTPPSARQGVAGASLQGHGAFWPSLFQSVSRLYSRGRSVFIRLLYRRSLCLASLAL